MYKAVLQVVRGRLTALPTVVERSQHAGRPDERSIRLGITRALEGDESGRAFLQALADQPGATAIPRTSWFDAFQSKRRLDHFAEVAIEHACHAPKDRKNEHVPSGLPHTAGFGERVNSDSRP